MKHAGVTPLHKKCNKNLKEDNRPVGILTILSKVFERSIFKQMANFFMIYLQNISMASEKDLVLNNVT